MDRYDPAVSDVDSSVLNGFAPAVGIVGKDRADYYSGRKLAGSFTKVFKSFDGTVDEVTQFQQVQWRVARQGQFGEDGQSGTLLLCFQSTGSDPLEVAVEIADRGVYLMEGNDQDLKTLTINL